MFEGPALAFGAGSADDRSGPEEAGLEVVPKSAVPTTIEIRMPSLICFMMLPSLREAPTPTRISKRLANDSANGNSRTRRSSAILSTRRNVAAIPF
jgi:hypothetical protein